MKIEGNVALITGGASGLGLATAELLHAHGAAVILFDLPGSPGKEITARLGDRASFAEGDVTKPDDVEKALDQAQELGRLAIAVNCAGTGNSIKTVGKNGAFPLEEFTRVLNINLVGTFNVIRLAAFRMSNNAVEDEERGVIVNTASAAAFDGQVGHAAYSASKGGVVGMTLPIARDLASLAIRVMTIAPGPFETPMLAPLPEEAKKELGAQIPHPSRLGRPREYASLVGQVVTNPMLNGETIRIDGALRMSHR
ncbi:3-hydroxyacyl-CoA dehydrogenase [Streptomyces sp. NPDC051976]|uniref:3-hydroxyacyl-CoA dehydrogenase n=1 Tax=Streptomyces sp. NPDC051976 TaxID=3154947 RepID=UPI003426BA4E